MTDPNYYQPPSEDPSSSPTPGYDSLMPNGWVPCPNCGSTHVEMPSFTWWGGAVGQKLLNHVKCQDCSYTYNAKTGKSNTTAIVIYQVVALVIVLGLLYALGLLG